MCPYLFRLGLLPDSNEVWFWRYCDQIFVVKLLRPTMKDGSYSLRRWVTISSNLKFVTYIKSGKYISILTEESLSRHLQNETIKEDYLWKTWPSCLNDTKFDAHKGHYKTPLNTTIIRYELYSKCLGHNKKEADDIEFRNANFAKR